LDVEGILEGQPRMRIKNLIESLNAQQRSVPQLPAQARARKISVLGAKTDPKHPFAGYMVGADESAESGAKRLGPDKNDPWEQGWRANPAHADNPYEQGTREYAQWADGQAERQAQPRHYDEGRAGVDDTDTVGFSVNTEAAYTAVMKRFGDVIDHDETSGIMYAPAGVWPRIEMVAYDADGEGAVRDDGVDESGVTEVAEPTDDNRGFFRGEIKKLKDGSYIATNAAGNRKQFNNRSDAEKFLNGIAEGERNEMDTPAVQAALARMAERHKGEKWSKEQLAALGKRIAARGQKKKGVDETVSTHKGGQITKTPTGIKHQAAPGNYGGYEPDFDHLQTLNKSITGRIERSMDIKHKREKEWQGGIELDEAVTKEDIITKLKARLGDYLSDISKEIKKDPDLINKLAAKPAGNQMGPPVKTITTDDGHEISIHGNEDDGFRISIKNQQTASRFNNLDEAVMACEMYCARRRQQAVNADYVEEA
jgi:hypothetical protein